MTTTTGLTLADLFPPDDLTAAIEAGHVTRKQHPDLPISIMTYTRECQYGHIWTPVTMACRGLIADDASGAVVAYPFPKIFVTAMHGVHDFAPPLPTDEPFEIFEKADGCFPTNATLNLWGGGTITIGEVVRNRLPVTLVGMDEHGNLAPATVTDWHRNGRKDHWLDITVDSHASRTSGSGAYPSKLRVTVNHHIHVNGEYKPACDVRPGDELVGQTWQPSEEAIRLIRASMLGDGCIVSSPSKPSVAKYQEPHSAKHSAYTEAIRKALGDCAANRTDTTSGYGSTLTWAGSREYAALGDMRRVWYPEGIKRVPADLSWLDDFAVAKWYMDDGSLSHSEGQRDRARFATNGFTEEEVCRLAARLTEMYGVGCSVFDAKGWTLRVNAGKDRPLDLSIDRMWSAIAPHIHPAMRYKLPEQWRDVPYVEMAPGREIAVPKVVRVLKVESVAPTKANFPSGRIGYDITTTTSNYLARGVLVHNSLAIIYNYDGRWHAASKGSFTSDQAQWAQQRIDAADLSRLDPELTYLAEAIYPGNRIVVDYRDREDLVLLAAYRPADGTEELLSTVAPHWTGIGPVACSWGLSSDLAELEQLALASKTIDGDPAGGTEEEGYVIRYASGQRAKIKLSAYLVLHKLFTGTNERTIWEVLASGQDPAVLFDTVPDEFADWARNIAMRLAAEHGQIVAEVHADFGEVISQLPPIYDRKSFALLAKETKHRSALFLLVDGRLDAVAAWAWKQIKPRGDKPFKTDEDN